MYGIILLLHIGSASLAALFTVVTLLGALLGRGSVAVSKWVLLSSVGGTLATGGGLVYLSGLGMQRVCLSGSALVVAAWGAHGLLRWRLAFPVATA